MMHIGILDDSIIEEAIGYILQHNPKHKIVLKEDGSINIEGDAERIIEWMEQEGMYLIVSTNGYKIASAVSEGIFGSVGNAVSGAVTAAAGAAKNAATLGDLRKTADAIEGKTDSEPEEDEDSSTDTTNTTNRENSSGQGMSKRSPDVDPKDVTTTAAMLRQNGQEELADILEKDPEFLKTIVNSIQKDDQG